MVSTAYAEQRRVMVVTEARQAEDGSAHRMVIAARDRSRNQDEINLAGVRFDNYRKNPVVLWNHDASPRLLAAAPPSGGIPIAKTLEIGHDEEGRIVASFEFNSNDPFAERVENAWNNGFLRAASIHYLPTRIVEVKDARGRVERVRIEESELLEWSLVPVPADPDSVRAAARAVGLPEEIFCGLEPEPEPEPEEAEPVTEEPSPNPEPREADPFIDALRERVVALEQEFRELTARDTKPQEELQETQEAPTPDEAGDPILAAIVTQFATMRQIIEEK